MCAVACGSSSPGLTGLGGAMDPSLLPTAGVRPAARPAATVCLLWFWLSSFWDFNRGGVLCALSFTGFLADDCARPAGQSVLPAPRTLCPGVTHNGSYLPWGPRACIAWPATSLRARGADDVMVVGRQGRNTCRRPDDVMVVGLQGSNTCRRPNASLLPGSARGGQSSKSLGGHESDPIRPVE